MRLLPKSVYTWLSLSFLAFAVPYVAFAAGDPNLFPIVPQSGACFCEGTAPDWGCVLQLVQGVINAVVELGIILCVVWLAYGGFSLMVSGGSSEARSQAKQRLLNAMIGIAVILLAWLVVDFVMKVVYDPETAVNGETFGPWNAIWAPKENSECLIKRDPRPLVEGVLDIITGATSGPSSRGAGAVGKVQGLCKDDNTACSVSVMKSEGLNEAQAQAMSCIAMTESTGGLNAGDSGTGARGLFQITGENWKRSEIHKPPCSTSSSRDDMACNRQAAVLMMKRQGYQPWTGKCNDAKGCGKVSYGQYWNPNAVACVNKYDPGH